MSDEHKDLRDYAEEDRQEELNKFGEEELKRYMDDDFSAHEALDRTFMLHENFEYYVMNHPTVLSNKDVHKKAYDINISLCELYQEIGRIRFHLDEVDSNNE